MSEDIFDRLSREREIKTLGRIGGGGGAVMVSCDTVREAIEEITRLREERRWIPVGERLPEEGKSVLVSTTRGEVEVAGYETFANGNLWWTMSSGDPVWVTHWMPLPAPPNGGEGE